MQISRLLNGNPFEEKDLKFYNEKKNTVWYYEKDNFGLTLFWIKYVTKEALGGDL